MYRSWGNIFSPGCHPSNLLGFVPALPEESMAFYTILEEQVGKGDVVRLKTLTEHLVIYVIGGIIL